MEWWHAAGRIAASKDNLQTQAKFLCVDCGYENHVDVVGAIRLLNGLGTHRSDSNSFCLSARRKAFLQVGEDVKRLMGLHIARVAGVIDCSI